MAVQPPSKTLPQDKDIVVSESKVTGNSEPREQLNEVLSNFDEAIQKEIADRIADVDAEEERALIAEAYLAKLIEEERKARIEADGGLGFGEAIQDEAAARETSDNRIIQSINSDREPLSIHIASPNLKAVQVAPAWEHRIDPQTGSPIGRIVIPNGSDVSNFNGGLIDFTTGYNQVGNNFQVIDFANNENAYARYLIILLPNDTIEVRPSNGFHSSNPTLAPYPSLATNGILVGSVVVRDNGEGGVGTIADIDVSNISYFKDSLGASQDSAPVINTSPLEVQENEVFTYYTKSDFLEEGNSLVEATNGIDDTASNARIILPNTQALITKDLIGPQAHEDAFFLNAVQAKIMYNPEKIDKNPTVQFSVDGGENWINAADTYLPGSELGSEYRGNLVMADLSLGSNPNPIIQSTAESGNFTSGQMVGAIISPQYNTYFHSFALPVRSIATQGSVIAKIYKVYAGTPQAVVRTSAEIMSMGSDITSSSQYKTFSFKPMIMKKGEQYALVIEAVAANGLLEVSQTSDNHPYNISSTSKNGGGWLASGNKLCFKMYGYGYELKMKITANESLYNSEILGFGVNYITDTTMMNRGEASWEDRIVTSTEAANGIITFNQCRYTPGIRQLRLNIEGVEYFAPDDFSEIGPSIVQFPNGFLQAGKKLRFYNTYGLVNGEAIANSDLRDRVSSLEGDLSVSIAMSNLADDELNSRVTEVESKLTVTPISIPANNIDWNSSDMLFKDVSANTTFTFSNVAEGKTISVAVTNTSGAQITITFPTGIFKVAGALTIGANEAAIYTFMRMNSKTYMTHTDKLVNT
jgi:hypothetical protein